MEQFTSATLIERKLGTFCRTVRFRPGDVLRKAGHHYTDMYWLTEGELDVALEGVAARFMLGAESPVGEISFLRGCPATATVTARTAGAAIVLDDPTLLHLGESEPAWTASLLRYLATVADERTSTNLTFVSSGASPGPGIVAIHLCRSPEMIQKAQRLRYEVYCEELGRTSPHADHARRIITDPLDAFAHTFIALEGDEPIATLRGNLSAEGSVGILEELYGMRNSPRHPAATSICTKFVVKKAKRGGPAALKLVAAMVRFGLRHGVEECYIDSIPALVHYYKALGFRVTGEAFFHRENGPSLPMMVNVTRHGARLSKDFTARGYLRFYLTAQTIKLWDRGKSAATIRPWRRQ
jgi:hypothetical protein